MKVLITGAGGFVGRHLSADLMGRNVAVTGLHRGSTEPPVGVRSLVLASYTDLQACRAALQGVDVVVHLAALAHDNAAAAAGRGLGGSAFCGSVTPSSFSALRK